MFPNFNLKIYFKPLHCNEKPISKLKKRIIDSKYNHRIDYEILQTIDKCISLVRSFDKSFSVDLDDKATVVKFGDYFFNGLNNFILVFGDEKFGIDPEVNKITTDFVMLNTRNSINICSAFSVFLYEFLIS